MTRPCPVRRRITRLASFGAPPAELEERTRSRRWTPLPSSCAVVWNPSLAGGAKSEDTVLVSDNGLEVVTATPGLPSIELDGLARPAIVRLA